MLKANRIQDRSQGNGNAHTFARREAIANSGTEESRRKHYTSDYAAAQSNFGTRSCRRGNEKHTNKHKHKHKHTHTHIQTNMSFFRITLHRSAIGLPQRTRDVLAALGLRRRNQTVVHAVSPSIAGLVFRVKELVRVAEVEDGREATLANIRAARRPDPGYVVTRRHQDGVAAAAAAATEGANQQP